MNRLQQAHDDMEAALASLAGVKRSYIRYINIWDDQIAEEITGESYSFDTPSVFIEFILGEAKMLMGGISTYPECVIRLHIVTKQLNKIGGKMDSNYDSFETRNKIKRVFLNWNITGCSSLMCFDDKLDFKHKQVSVYLMAFRTNFIDLAGSIFDRDDVFVLAGNIQIALEKSPNVYVDGNENQYEYQYEYQ